MRVRKPGALLIAAVIALVGAVPLAGTRWELTPLLLIPAAFAVWAYRAGTDVDTDGLRVRALLGSTSVSWSRIVELAPDRRGQVSALLDDGAALRLTGVTTDNLSDVLAAGGQQVAGRQQTDGEPRADGEQRADGGAESSTGGN